MSKKQAVDKITSRFVRENISTILYDESELRRESLNHGLFQLEMPGVNSHQISPVPITSRINIPRQRSRKQHIKRYDDKRIASDLTFSLENPEPLIFQF